METTHNNLPEAVTRLKTDVAEIKRLLLEKGNEQPTQPPADQLLTVQETAGFLDLTVPTIYSKVSRRELPFMKRGKRLYFSRTELMEYLKAGREKTNAEKDREAEAYLATKRGAER